MLQTRYRPSISRLQEEFLERQNIVPKRLRISDQTSFDQGFSERHQGANSVSDWIGLSRDFEKELIDFLPSAEPDEAIILLLRSPSPAIAKSALTNPSRSVQALALQHLHEFAEAGDPFSKAILEGRETP